MSETAEPSALNDQEIEDLYLFLSAAGDSLPESLEPLRLRLQAALYARTSIAEMEALQQRIREMSR